jgi:hypothetical protein
MLIERTRDAAASSSFTSHCTVALTAFGFTAAVATNITDVEIIDSLEELM